MKTSLPRIVCFFTILVSVFYHLNASEFYPLDAADKDERLIIFPPNTDHQSKPNLDEEAKTFFEQNDCPNSPLHQEVETLKKNLNAAHRKGAAFSCLTFMIGASAGYYLLIGLMGHEGCGCMFQP